MILKISLGFTSFSIYYELFLAILQNLAILRRKSLNCNSNRRILIHDWKILMKEVCLFKIIIYNTRSILKIFTFLKIYKNSFLKKNIEILLKPTSSDST